MSTQIERQDDSQAQADITDPSAEEQRAAYRWMLLARCLDERMWQLIRQGKGHFAVPCWGHEAVNFAAIHRLPCVFCCENNRYTQSVPLSLESAVSTIADRGAAYGMPGV